MTARITIPKPVPIPAWSDSEVARLLAISSPPASLLSPWSSSPPQIPFPLPPPNHLHHYHYHHPHLEDRPEVNLPPRKRLGIALGPRYEVGESSAAAGLRDSWMITDSWDEIVETLQGAPVSTDTELGAHVREFESMVRRDTDEIYMMLDDEQMSMHITRVHMMETEARMSREAWGRSMDASDLARAERAISDLLETDRRRREEMRELRAADRARQQQIIQTLTVMQTLQREMIPLQRLVTTLQGQGPVGGPAQPELPEEAGSSS
ncbi:hypothetical protein Tco_0831133 [Tanacetum coccineum]